MRPLSLRFLTRQGCHLCDDARAILSKAARGLGVVIEEVDIDTDDVLTSLFGLRIPVILDDRGTVLAEGVIDDASLLRRALRTHFPNPG